ncbi:MAG: FAD-binding oxidoreductase [Candidatus Helarchaeota archaeon]
MVLDKKVYEEFEKVLGPENISDDPVITDTYAYNWCVEFLNVMDGKEGEDIHGFYYRPEAVVLPSTTEEVQKIVKLCKKYGLKFKASSTGLGPWNCVSQEGVIFVDLRRMNKIIKIDTKNMYAVVESYVSGGQLQAEAMKVGLNCHMPGCGPMGSPLASATSMCGPGFTSASTGFSDRNVLGVEWVLPTGEILRLGSWGLKDNQDWYSGDGPGPSLRGVMRGFIGAKSGLGIFTKVAIKLYPYPCDTSWKITGVLPNYDFEIPNYIRYHVLAYKTYEALENAMIRIEEEGICFMCFHTSSPGVATIFSFTAEEMMKKFSTMMRYRRPLIIVTAAQTEREFNYKEKVLNKLIEETNGKEVTKKLAIPNVSYADGLRCNLGYHGFLISGAFQSTHGPMETMTMCRHMIEANIPLKKEFIKKGVVANDEGEGAWSTSYEHGHFYHCEMPTMYDQTNIESVKGMVEYTEKCNELDLVKHLGIPFFIEGDKMHDWYGPYCSNYHVWLRKIKEAFDPENVADSGFYISTEKEKSKKEKK